MEGSHTSWSHGAARRDIQQGKWGRVKEGSRGSWAGCLIPAPANIFTQHRLSPKLNPLSWPDEAVCFNQMLRRQKPRGPEQRLVFVSCGGNESAGTAHRQTEVGGAAL